MKKRGIALLICLVVVIAGAVGAGGTYLGNIFANEMNAYYDAQQPVNNGGSSGNASGAIQPGIDNSNPASDDSVQTGSLATPEIASGETPTLSIATDTMKTQELTIPEIAALNSGSVVEIYTESMTGSGRMGQFVTQGAGSGVIMTQDGYIATNNHVIDGANKITVRTSDGVDYDATLVGRDSKSDLAVLRISATGLKPATFGDSDKLMTGELAVAIGNPLGKLGGTVSEGIISALSRSIDIDGTMMTLLQTTAAVNPGNSGGGLFNRFGELVGIVNAKSSGAGIEGIGFAIPVNLAKSIIEELMQYGYVPGRIDLGASLVDVPDQMTAWMYRVSETGVYVAQADTDSPLQMGDRIVSIAGTTINSSDDITTLFDNYKAGDTLPFTVSRNGQLTTFNLTLKQAKS